MGEINCSPLPGVNPVLFSLGPLDVRWYALAYIAGLLLAWRIYLQLTRAPSLWSAGRDPAVEGAPLSRDDVDELLFLATLGVILGGRIGYVVFYQIDWIWTDPVRTLRIWDGGMSFHGGLIGVALAMSWLAWSRKKGLLRVADGASVVTPIGVGLVRIANFINGELYGRHWDGPWAVEFPCDQIQPPVPRHPSQLYEAALEGLVLGVVLLIAVHQFKALRRPGLATGIFLIGYGVFRTIIENFREPDAELILGITRGQLLSTPMWIAGAAFMIWALARPPAGTPRAA